MQRGDHCETGPASNLYSIYLTFKLHEHEQTTSLHRTLILLCCSATADFQRMNERNVLLCVYAICDQRPFVPLCIWSLCTRNGHQTPDAMVWVIRDRLQQTQRHKNDAITMMTTSSIQVTHTRQYEFIKVEANLKHFPRYIHCCWSFLGCTTSVLCYWLQTNHTHVVELTIFGIFTPTRTAWSPKCLRCK